MREVQEAIKRLRLGVMYEGDYELLARAYLAEHPADDSQSVKVRIAVAVDEHGNYKAYGSSWLTDPAMMQSVVESLYKTPALIRIITATLPVPEAVEVQAEVEADRD